MCFFRTLDLRKQGSRNDQSVGSMWTIPVPSSPRGLAASSHCWKNTFLTEHFAFPQWSGVSLPPPPALGLHHCCSEILSWAKTETRISIYKQWTDTVFRVSFVPSLLKSLICIVFNFPDSRFFIMVLFLHFIYFL